MTAGDHLIVRASPDLLPTDLLDALCHLSDEDFIIAANGSEFAHAVLCHATQALPTSDPQLIIVFGDAEQSAALSHKPNVIDVVDWPNDIAGLRKDFAGALRSLRRELQRRQDDEARTRLSAARVRIASADLDLDALMTLVCEELLTLTTAEATVVEMVDGDDIVYRAAAGTIQDKVGFRMPVKGSLSGCVLASGELLVSADTECDDRVNIVATRALNIRSMAIAPLRGRSGLVGVLKMASSSPHAFKDVDLDAVAAMSDLIGGALQRELERTELRSLAHTDPLTGMLNRRGFEELAQRSAERSRFDGAASGALMIDIDHFKTINDTYGHAGGDAVLQSVGETLRRLVRPSDIIGRIGGEEIAVVLPGSSLANALATAERIRSEIAGIVVPFDGQWIRATVSIGVAPMLPGQSLAESLASADEALYRAKGLGRNRVDCAVRGVSLVAAQSG